VLTALPAISQPVVIDGSSQPRTSAEAVGTPAIELRAGPTAVAANRGLLEVTRSSQIFGLAFTQFPANGYGISVTANDTLVVGCSFGVTPDGHAAAAVTQGIGAYFFRTTGGVFGGWSTTGANIVGACTIGLLANETIGLTVRNVSAGTNRAGTGAIPNETGVVLRQGTTALGISRAA
jgi:hypothetical protein